MQEESKNNLTSESTREMLDKAAQELALLFIALVEQKFNRNKYNKKYGDRNKPNKIQDKDSGGREMESNGHN